MVSQPLPTSGRRGFEIQAAAEHVSAASARADDGVRRLRSTSGWRSPTCSGRRRENAS